MFRLGLGVAGWTAGWGCLWGSGRGTGTCRVGVIFWSRGVTILLLKILSIF